MPGSGDSTSLAPPRRALLVIDVQNDFVEGGSLAVPHGSDVIKSINHLCHNGEWAVVVASQDWHPVNHTSFGATHGVAPFESWTLKSVQTGREFATTLWPAHCVQDTAGAAFVEGLELGPGTRIVRKGDDTDMECYSAFTDVFGEKETGLAAILYEAEVTEVVVTGLAFEFCVMHTALDAVERGFLTSVDMSATRAITSDGAAAAIARLSARGVTLTNKSLFRG